MSINKIPPTTPIVPTQAPKAPNVKTPNAAPTTKAAPVKDKDGDNDGS